MDHPLKRETLEKIDHWQEVLTRGLEDSSAEREKHRLESELAELQQARIDVDTMTAEQLRRLCSRLDAQSPLDWMEHRSAASRQS